MGAPKVLNRCFNCVQWRISWCFKTVSRVFKGCFQRKFNEHLKYVSTVLKMCLNGVKRVFHGSVEGDQ